MYTGELSTLECKVGFVDPGIPYTELGNGSPYLGLLSEQV